MDNQYARRRAGFTLIEIMVVVIIIAALAGMVVPRFFKASDEAKSNIARGDIANITTGLKLFRLHNDRYPSTEEGLQALVSRTSSARNWDGPYLEGSSRPEDPWDRAYEYRSPGSHNAGGIDIWSLGADGTASDDDVTNWEK